MLVATTATTAKSVNFIQLQQTSLLAWKKEKLYY